jgi:hypothetical protein
MATYRISYGNWENATLQRYVRNAFWQVWNQGGGDWQFPWLRTIMPEYVNAESGGFWPWNSDIPVESIIGDINTLRARLAWVGGPSAIGFNPGAELAALQAAFPGYYIPDGNGNMYFEATPNTGDFLGTAILVTGIVIFTMGAASGFGIAAATEGAAASSAAATETTSLAAESFATDPFAFDAASLAEPTVADSVASSTAVDFVGDVPLAADVPADFVGDIPLASDTAVTTEQSGSLLQTIKDIPGVQSAASKLVTAIFSPKAADVLKKATGLQRPQQSLTLPVDSAPKISNSVWIGLGLSLLLSRR